MNKLVTKAEKLLRKCNVCSVASISEDGYPRICILMPLKNVSIKEFWFSTGASGTKVRHFRSNGKAGVSFYYGGDSVTLTGDMEIVADKTIKDSIWQDFLKKHFPNGGKEDPEYCVLHFIAKQATIYVEEEFETIEI